MDRDTASDCAAGGLRQPASHRGADKRASCARRAKRGSRNSCANASANADGTVARKDILIMPSNVNIPAPDIWNPYIPAPSSYRA